MGHAVFQCHDLFRHLDDGGDVERPWDRRSGNSQQAALALKPLAGKFAYLLFAVGIIGIDGNRSGLADRWATRIRGVRIQGRLVEKIQESQDLLRHHRRGTLIGLGMNLLRIDIMKALYFAAVINGSRRCR